MILDVNLDRGKLRIDPSMLEPVLPLDQSIIQVNFRHQRSIEISFCSRRASNPDIAFPAFHGRFEAREGNTATLVVRSSSYQSPADPLVPRARLFPRQEKMIPIDRCRGSRIYSRSRKMRSRWATNAFHHDHDLGRAKFLHG